MGAQAAVAPEHFELTMDSEGMLLKNMGSAGTLVNGLRVYNEARVQPGDVVGMGAPVATSSGGLLSFRLGSFDFDPDAVTQEPTAGSGFEQAWDVLPDSMPTKRRDPMLEELALIRSSAAGSVGLQSLDMITLDSQVAPLAVQRCAAQACAINSLPPSGQCRVSEYVECRANSGSTIICREIWLCRSHASNSKGRQSWNCRAIV